MSSGKNPNCLNQILLTNELRNEFCNFQKYKDKFCYKLYYPHDSKIHCSCDYNTNNLNIVKIFDKKVIKKPNLNQDFSNTIYCKTCKFHHSSSFDQYIILCRVCLIKHKNEQQLDLFNDISETRNYKKEKNNYSIKKCNNFNCTIEKDIRNLIKYKFDVNYPRSNSEDDKYLCNDCFYYAYNNKTTRMNFLPKYILVDCTSNSSKFCYSTVFKYSENLDKELLSFFDNYVCNFCKEKIGKSIDIAISYYPSKEIYNLFKIRNFPVNDDVNLSTLENYNLCLNIFRNETITFYGKEYLLLSIFKNSFKLKLNLSFFFKEIITFLMAILK